MIGWGSWFVWDVGWCGKLVRVGSWLVWEVSSCGKLVRVGGGGRG
ncbi:hypothetical protein [Okeania sp. KiyG1]|nr:hypothetical protein [Okeania sp. KiyG1]